VRLKLNTKKAQLELSKQVNDQYVVVGILDSDTFSRFPQKNKLLRQIKGRDKSLVAMRKGKFNRKLSLRQLAMILDAKRGIFRHALKYDDGGKRQLAEDFLNLKKTETDIKRLQNNAQAIVKVPLLNKSYGKNKPSTIKRKGFDRFGVQTGQLFENIKGRYYAKGNTVFS
jgi:hypothetical protein